MLQLKNIYFSAEENGIKKDIINNISLNLDENFIAFTGPNGGGKSTLAKIIMGIIKPTSGQIIFNGINITEMNITERAKLGISFAFQQPVKFKGLTVNDLLNISSGKQLAVYEVCNYLSEVGLCAKEYLNREINSSLSGGELKRIEIAITLARQGSFTIFDEPEAGIDLWSFNNLISVFQRLSNNIKGNILIISHQEKILKIADRIILISEGKIQEDGKTKDILPKLSSSSVCSALKVNKSEAI